MLCLVQFAFQNLSALPSAQAADSVATREQSALSLLTIESFGGKYCPIERHPAKNA